MEAVVAGIIGIAIIFGVFLMILPTEEDQDCD